MPVLKIINANEPGKYHDDKSYDDLARYIERTDKTLGKYIGGRAISPYQAAMEMRIVTESYGKSKGVHLRHMVLSFDHKCEPIAPEHAMALAFEIAGFYCYRYQIIYGVHCDTEHLHIHFIMNQVSYLDGRKYPGTKKDFYDFQGYVSAILDNLGMRLFVVSNQNERFNEKL